MLVRCPSCRFRHAGRATRAVVIGAVLSAVTPVGAVDAWHLRLPVDQRVSESSGEHVEPALRLPALSQVVPLRVHPADLWLAIHVATPAVPPADAADTGVRISVSGVPAVVQHGTFAARVRVTPHTLIFSTVATIPRGMTTRHQIEIEVGDGPESGLHLHPVPLFRAAALEKPLSLVASFAPAPLTADRERIEDAHDHTAAPGPTAGGLALGGSDDPSLPLRAAAGAGAVRAETPALAPLALDVPRFEAEARQARPGIAMVTSEAAESRAGPRILKPFDLLVPSDLSPLTLRRSRDGDLEQNPRGMPFGGEYSFGVLFIFGTDGFLRVRCF